ncbi:MAG TPA: archease [Chromatiales bacterium]|nr:archease [Thiotrichales bacterium]HIP68588.1 archease [Chromatiales bacterium]
MQPSQPHWEHFEHGADIGVRGYGGSLEEAFTQAALAMTAVVTDLAIIRPVQTVEIQCKEPDSELLLVDWLNALVYEMATRKMIFSRFNVAIEDNVLTATAYGEPIDVERHEPTVEIKGATYTELKVSEQDDGQWCAQCVVDV